MSGHAQLDGKTVDVLNVHERVSHQIAEDKKAIDEYADLRREFNIALLNEHKAMRELQKAMDALDTFRNFHRWRFQKPLTRPPR